MKTIADFINHLECPIINGIIYSDGTIQLLDVKLEFQPLIKYSVRSADKTSINSLENKGNLYEGSCAVLARIIDDKNNIEVIAGEASYGSDGFVAVIDLESKEMIWLVYLTESNPFNQLVIEEDYLIAKTTLDCIWRFNLKNPIDISVE
ncbi:hypothetical protein C8P68_107148 [Mucilaginibacter yixingensis]|uniref:Uncharacterized protein n=1 Tax=Mucilaginibacter yixingensis TaxID=1295612 RepID=A0A2T5J6B1_9SPHI|nr:hypothetical protein [Mucilaginibacter yixingensis]PTQ94085.1 hypothetical protein C8P68_107148 [Mucilaginibacter yixingensis]